VRKLRYVLKPFPALVSLQRAARVRDGGLRDNNRLPVTGRGVARPAVRRGGRPRPAVSPVPGATWSGPA